MAESPLDKSIQLSKELDQIALPGIAADEYPSLDLEDLDETYIADILTEFSKLYDLEDPASNCVMEEDDYADRACISEPVAEKTSEMQEFLSKDPSDIGYKSFNSKIKPEEYQEYINRQEWFALSSFFQKISHPTKFDCELLASSLGSKWTASKVQNWFQHERNRKVPSKFSLNLMEPKDTALWNSFISTYSFNPELVLMQQIQSAKQRCASFLATSEVKNFWHKKKFKCKGNCKDLMRLLELVYSDDVLPEYNSKNDAKQISELFDCAIMDISVEKPVAKPLLNITPKVVKHKVECNWKDQSLAMCSCQPQNDRHCIDINFDGAEKDATYYNLKNANSKWRSDHIINNHMMALKKHYTYIDDVIIEFFLLKLNSCQKKPIYFMSSKTVAFFRQQKGTKYMMDKFDQTLMTNADTIYVPINYHAHHWQLLAIDFCAKKFILYDGCRFMDDTSYKESIIEFLQQYYADLNHHRAHLNYRDWKYEACEDFPIQRSGTECGPMLIRGALDMAYLPSDKWFLWSERDTKYLRKWFTAIISSWVHGSNQTIYEIFSNKCSVPNTPLIPLQPSTVYSYPNSPTKKASTQFAAIMQSKPESNNLMERFLSLNIIDLLRLGILTRIKLADASNSIHRDFQNQKEWLVDNIHNWPQCILTQIPSLKKSYLTLVLQSDFCIPTGNLRTDFGMALLCWTTKCCSSRCMLTLMQDLIENQLEWKKSSKEERNKYIALKSERTVCTKEGDTFVFRKLRNHCTRAWQAVYGVHSPRMNSASSKQSSPQKSVTWENAVKQIDATQLHEIDQHIERTLLPNPFAPKGAKDHSFVLPPNLTSIHQLYWDYVWNHISKCPNFKKNQRATDGVILFERTKRKFEGKDKQPVVKKQKIELSSKGFSSHSTFIKSGIYQQLEKSSELHNQFCHCVVHYGSWYKNFSKKWKNQVTSNAFSRTWCSTCQNYIDESTKWHKFKNSQTIETKKSKKYFDERQKWKQIKDEWQKHYDLAQQEREHHELLRDQASRGSLRLICFDFKTSLVCPYWGYHCAPTQVHYLSRMGVYFFGIVDEGDPDSFTGYVYPENYVDSDGPAATKKGASHVIAMLYDFMLNNGLTDSNRATDRKLHFAADNCSGQNKNQFVIKFFCAAVDQQWADDVFLDFMIPGHTKFGPDRWFGRIGKEIIKLDAWNVDELIENIRKSLSYKQKVEDLRKVNCRNFKSFLDTNYTKPKELHVLEYYHFWFSSKHPGAVRVKVKNDDPWSEPIQLRKVDEPPIFEPQTFPKFKVVPLSAARMKVMREIKNSLKHTEVTLDYEEYWDDWDFQSRDFEVQEILQSRISNGVEQFKVKFKADRYNDWSADKYDEWLKEEQLENAQKALQQYKQQKSKQKKITSIKFIHGYDEQKQLALVEWEGFPLEQDRTWESIEAFDDDTNEMLATFKVASDSAQNVL